MVKHASGFSSTLGVATCVVFALCMPAVTAAAPSPSGAFFHLVEKRGTWWLAPPRGDPFFSLGVDCVDTGDDKSDFKPDNPSYASYLYYPSDAAWQADTLRRLREWHVNTLGAWSDDSIQHSGMPYTLELEFGGSSHVPWSDIYSDDVAKTFDGIARKTVAAASSDPNLIGYFTDNEIGWWDDTMWVTFLGYTPDNKTRQMLVKMLRDRYGNDFAKLRRDFTPAGADSFDALDKGGTLKLIPGGQGRGAIDEFIYRYASKYYQLAHDAIRRYDTNHLILGDRYCGWYSRSVARAAGPYVDVISTNYGADWSDGDNARYYFDSLHRLTGKPVMVTEFYFCATENRSGDKNSSAGFQTVQTQAERAVGFRTQLASFAALPYVVGAHWFQYYDEPGNGRGDGENYNMGLVDVHNKPYDDMIRAAQSLDLETIHATGVFDGQRLPATTPTTVCRIPEAPPQPMAGLTSWDKMRGFIAASAESGPPFADLYACWDAGKLYLGVQTMDFREAKMYRGDKVPREEQLEWRVRIGDAAPITVWATSSDDEKETAALGLPSVSDPRASVAEVRPGLRSAVTVALPASELKRGAFRRGEAIPISVRLVNHGREESDFWHTTLVLSDGSTH